MKQKQANTSNTIILVIGFTVMKKLFAEMLNEGERITGEWLLQAHGLKYKIDNDPILFFDYFTPKNERLLQPICDKLQVNTA